MDSVDIETTAQILGFDYQMNDIAGWNNETFVDGPGGGGMCMPFHPSSGTSKQKKIIKRIYAMLKKSQTDSHLGTQDNDGGQHPSFWDDMMQSPRTTQQMTGLQPSGPSDAGLGNTSISTDEGEDELDSDPVISLRDEHSSPMLRLLSLISDIHSTLGRVNNGPWARSCKDSQSLNGYPIGRVLHLSQRLESVVQDTTWVRFMSGTTGAVPSGSKCSHNSTKATSFENFGGSAHLQSPEQAMDSSESEVADESMSLTTVLLVLTCYVSLAKLHAFVFTHLETHVSVPQKTPSLMDMTSPQTSEQLRFEHLPSADELYSRCHNAIRILLDAFSCVERAMGLPHPLCVLGTGARIPSAGHRRGPPAPGFSRSPDSSIETPFFSSLECFQMDVIPALLKQEASLDGRSVQEGFGGLLAKVRSLQRVVHDRLNLE